MSGNYFFHLLWGVGLILAPLISRVSERSSFLESKDIFFYFLVGILSFFSIGKNKMDKSILMCFAFLTIQAFIISFDFFNFFYWYQFQMFTVGCVSLIILSKGYDNKKRNIILNCVCICGVVQVIWASMGIFGIEPYEKINELLYGDSVKFITKDRYDASGSMGNTNLSGAMIALTFPAFLRKKWIYLSPLILAGVLFTQSSMALLTLVGSGLYYIYNRYFSAKFIPVILFFTISFV